MRVISELLNNKKIRDIEPEDLQELVLTLQFLPLRLKSEQISHLDKIINENKKHPERCISDKTCADYVQSLKSIFTWALKRKYIRENVMDEIDIPSPEKQKRLQNTSRSPCNNCKKSSTVTFIPNIGIITDNDVLSFGLGYWAYIQEPDLMKFVSSNLMIFKKKTVLNLSA